MWEWYRVLSEFFQGQQNDGYHHARNRQSDGNWNNWIMPPRPWKSHHLAVGDVPLILDEELLLTGGADELSLGAKRQGYHIVVFCILVLNDLESHGDARETASVVTGVLSSNAHGQNPRLV